MTTNPAIPQAKEARLWRLDLICCGFTDGHIVRLTWTEAAEFRGSYIDTDGHDRQAILSQDFAHDGACSYSDGCPAPGASFLVPS